MAPFPPRCRLNDGAAADTEQRSDLKRQLKSVGRLGPPGVEGHGCALCHDPEARQFAATLRGMVETVGKARH